MDRREFDEIRRRIREIPFRRIIIIAAIALAALLVLAAPFTIFFTVGAAQEGVVLRFGRYLETVPPGLHWKLPFGIDRRYLVATAEISKEEFGFRTVQPDTRTIYDERGDYSTEAVMLTGDLRMADVKWVVQYRIRDPKAYLFMVRNPGTTLRDASQAVMRLVVGDYSLADVLTERRSEIEAEVDQRLQEALDNYTAGTEVVTVKLQEVNPPERVEEAYNEVNEARQEKETTINVAQKEYFKAIPEVRGAAQKLISEAEGFKARRVNEALGDVAKFSALLAEYSAAREVTRSRLYLEVLSDVLPGIAQLYVMDASQGRPLQILDLQRAASGVHNASAREGAGGRQQAPAAPGSQRGRRQ